MKTRTACLTILALMLFGIVGHDVYGRSESEAPPQKARAEQIQVAADRLESSRDKGFVEFVGKVEVTQGQFQIRSDRLRVYYDENINADNPVAESEAIKRIVAYGNVRIHTEKAEAKADRAEYRVAETLLILTGDHSTVTSQNNFITGSKITLNRTTGNITVEAKAGKRVRAVFYPDKELDLNPEDEQSRK